MGTIGPIAPVVPAPLPYIYIGSIQCDKKGLGAPRVLENVCIYRKIMIIIATLADNSTITVGDDKRL